MKTKYIFPILMALALVSCSKWLDLRPEGLASDKELYSTGDGYRSLLNGLYRNMAVKELYGIELNFGMLDCMSKQYNTEIGSYVLKDQKYIAAGRHDYDNNYLTASIKAIWLKGYYVIANANELIQGIESVDPSLFAKGAMEKEMITGEALACRAMMHFDLLRLFAPAPVNDDGKPHIPYLATYPTIKSTPQTVQKILEQVINDLETARKLVETYDTTALGKSTIASAQSRFFNKLESGMEGHNNEGRVDNFFMYRGHRLNYYSITALLARVCQYAGMREKAFGYAKKVIDFEVKSITGSTFPLFSKDEFWGFQWVEDFNEKKDLKVTSNLVFALYNENAYKDYNLIYFFKTTGSPLENNNWLLLDLDGQKIFETVSGEDESQKDMRYKSLIYLVDKRYPISAKYYLSNDTKIRNENLQIIPMIRATEMRYIMAEEYAKQGNLEEAYKILNEIREKRGAGDALKGADYNTFEADMIRDAQREWIAEGQLFFLYKRLNAKIAFSKTEKRALTFQESVLPVPSTESN